jgi:hypothetical protein
LNDRQPTIASRITSASTYVAFDVPVDGEYRVIAEPREGDKKARVEIKECAPGGPHPSRRYRET